MQRQDLHTGYKISEAATDDNREDHSCPKMNFGSGDRLMPQLLS